MISPVVGVFVIMGVVLLYAMHRKGRVKADFRFLGAAFTLEVDDKEKTSVTLLINPTKTQRRSRQQ